MTKYLVREGPLKGQFEVYEVQKLLKASIDVKDYGRVLSKSPRNVALFTRRDVAESLITRLNKEHDPVIEDARRDMEASKARYAEALSAKRAAIERIGIDPLRGDLG
jgi:hypothetical protein